MIYQRAKNLIWRYFCPSMEEVKNAIKNFPAISFDMFDTLVTRNVMCPTDIFSYVEILYQKNGGNISFDFKKKRIEAEKNIREKLRREVTLAEIYVALETVTGQDCTVFLELEKQCELLFIEPRKEIKAVYEECLRQKKKVYILSDMYLDKETIIQILHNCGYFDWTNIYISSDTGMTKRKGGLYKLFLTQELLSPHNVLHIGDSIKSDFLMSKHYNITQLLLENKRTTVFFDDQNPTKLSKQEWLDYKTLQAFCMNRTRGRKELSYILGYSVLGPILFAFSKWLNEIIQEEKPDCLSFMAREGMILKKAYERMFPQNMIPTCYLRTSRRSVSYPELLKAKTLSDISGILPVKRNEDLNGLLELLRLNNKNIWKQLKEAGYTQQTSITNISGKTFKILKASLRKKAEQQGKYLKRYLEQNQFHGKVLAVDIGWRGTTQHFLSKFCRTYMPEQNIQIKGCFLGVLTDNKQRSFAKDPKYGYWFNENCNEEWGYIVAISRMACELLFMPVEGSTSYYTEKNGDIFPHMDPIEFSDSDIRKIQKVQDAALDFIDEFQNSDIKNIVKITPQITLTNYFKFGIRPNKESLGFIDTFHYTEAGAVYSYKTKPFWKYIFNPHKWLKDFSNTAWKTGFMRECFVLDLPYYKFLSWLRRFDQVKTLRKNHV